MPHSELATHYQAADVFVLPSFLDSWGMVVNEAMACGTPVIVSSNVGSRDLVNCQNGFVFPAGDIDALAHQITECYNDRRKLVAMGRVAHESVSKMTWDSYYENVRATIREIWSGEQGQAA